MNTIVVIFETVHEQLKILYDTLVIFENGLLTDLPKAKRNLISVEKSLIELGHYLENNFTKLSSITYRKKDLTKYGKKHIMKIEIGAEGVADRFFESIDYSPGYYFLLSNKYQSECQRLDNHKKRNRS